MPLLGILAGALIGAITTFGTYAYLPVRYFDAISIEKSGDINVGTAFTQLSGSNTLSAFPTTYNANLAITANTSTANTFTGLQSFSNASTSLFSAFATSYFGGTATSTFNSAGVLTLVTPLAVGSGGTASTTPTSVLCGDGAGAYTSLGWGTSGHFLTSNGATTCPSWQAAAIDQAANYAWTGNHLWSTSASSTRFAALDTIYVGRTATTTIKGDNQASTIPFASTTAISVSTTASTTDLIISGTCTNCGRSFAGSDSTPNDVNDDDNVITVGFRPRIIHYVIEAADGNETSASWGTWTDAPSYQTLQTEGTGAPTRQTSNAHNNTFTDGRMVITFGSVTDTGFTISYDKGATFSSSATVSFTVIR